MAATPRLANAICPNFQDVIEGQANANWTLQDQSDSGPGPYGALLGATQALTVSGLFGAVSYGRTLIDASPVAGVYGTVLDQVVFRVQSGSFSSNLTIPAPVDSIFKPDTITVDLSNTLVQEWWSQVQAILGDSYGNPWTTLAWGQRRMIRQTP